MLSILGFTGGELSMLLWYNNIALHSLGRVSLMDEATKYEPEGSPQKGLVTLVFRIDAWNRGSYVTNREQLIQVKQALNVQHGKLKLVQERVPGTTGANDLTMFDQQATLAEHNFPQDPNEWGVHHQQIRITFNLAKHDLTTNGIAASFTPTGSNTTITLSHVYSFKEQRQARRFDENRDHREHVGGSITLKGKILGNMNQTLSARRASLASIKEQLESLEEKSGRLQYPGFFDRTVRVSDVNVDIDQATEHLSWEFTATYTRFPNEAGYAAARFEVSTRKGSNDGDVILSLGGRIRAESEARALAKLESLRTAVLAAHSFTAGRRQNEQIQRSNVSSSSFNQANQDVGDGDAFIEISFNEEYVKRDPDHLSFNLTVDGREDGESGLITVTYSGSVTCGFSGANAAYATETDKAYSIAVAKARELGENKHAFRVSGSIKRDERQTTKTAGIETVKVDFSFTYKFIGSRIFMEVSSSIDKSTFGEDVETVTGYIVGGNQAAIEEAYQTVRSGYNARLVRDDGLRWSENRVRNGSYAWTAGQALAATNVFAFTPSAGYESLKHRLEFSFRCFKPKADGSYAIKYGIRVSTNLKRLYRTVLVEGMFFGTESLIEAAANESEGNKLDLLLEALDYGRSCERNRDIDVEYVPNVTEGEGTKLALRFSERYESVIEGDDLVIECKVRERIRFSGNRNIVQPIPDGRSIVQQCGLTEARRIVSGEVIAGNETTARRWVKRQQSIPFPDADPQSGIPGAPTVTYPEPPDIDVEFDFMPFLDAEVRGDSDKGPYLCRVTFQFEEIIPDYRYV